MPHAVLVVDKPIGPTSHGVVARLRKALGTRAMGHAGTLDPAASGVLVVTIGEATKLVPYLSGQPKRYAATITFGRSTTTCDAQGETVAQAAIPDDVVAELGSLARHEPSDGRIARALEAERRRREQVPPVFSAVRLAGRRSYDRARRGEQLSLPPRAVSASTIEVIGATDSSLELALLVSKGYYVRSLASDLGEAIGLPAHLSSLRRTASGPFTIEEATSPCAPPDRIARAFVSLAVAVARIMPTVCLTDEGARRASHGQGLGPAHFATPAPDGLSAWLGPSGDLLAIGRSIAEDRFAVRRGFGCPTSP